MAADPSNANAPRFCPDCDVSMDLHYGEDDCENADRRARLVEDFGGLSVR